MKSILQVFSFDLLSRFLVGVLSFLLIRYMPPDEYGAYVFALSLSMVVAQSLASSFNRIYIVGYDTLNIGQSPSSFLGFQLLIIGAVVLFSLPFQSIVGSLYWLIVLLIFTTCLSEFSKTDFQQELRFIPSSLVEVFRSALFLALVVALIFVLRYELESWHVLLGQASVMLLAFLIASRHRIDFKNLFRIQEGFRTARDVLRGKYRFLFIYFFLMAFFSQTDVFMLRIFGDSLALPTYGSAFRYYTLLLIGLGSLHTVLLPSLQRTMMTSAISELLRRIRKLLFIFIPVVIVGAWASKWIIPWIDKGKYPDAVMAFQILSFSAIVSFAFSPYITVAMRFEDFGYLAFLTCIALILNILLNAALIPIMGAPGSAVATFISFGYVNVSGFFRVRKRLGTSA
jgi:O-antigen/teichoic acid export membrane protein